uniref:sterile alpha motif domain-containing protein 9-like n=1 Tax=Centroberyx gerrardi TaxID=166262 RepID=UPI003AADBBEE
NEEEDLSADIKDWSKHQVRQWALKEAGVDDKFADILLQQDIKGSSLLLLNESNLKNVGVTLGPAKLIIHARDKLKLRKEQPTSSRNHLRRPCKPYPFQSSDDTCTYMENSILDVTESGASDLIEACHEFKAFTNTRNATDEEKMKKFTTEVICFAAACMNSRTNGTIHFGVGDKPDFIHGQVLGVHVEDREAYGNALNYAINSCFEYKQKVTARHCISHPRFVGVQNKDMTLSDKCVIEVDIIPDSMYTKGDSYHIWSDKKKGKKRAKGEETDTTEKNPKRFYVRDGSSSSDLLAPANKGKYDEYHRFDANQLSQLRKQAEEKHLKVSSRKRFRKSGGNFPVSI